MRINVNKPKGKNTMKEKKKRKKIAGSPIGIWTCTPTSSSAKSDTSYQWAMWPLHSFKSLKLIALKYFTLPFTLFEPCGAVFIMNSKTHLRKNNLNEHFKAISHYFLVYLLSGCLMGARWTHSFFFFAALGEVQVAVLSVLNLPRQGFPATCQIGHCCVCSPLLLTWAWNSLRFARWFANVQ